MSNDDMYLSLKRHKHDYTDKQGSRKLFWKIYNIQQLPQRIVVNSKHIPLILTEESKGEREAVYDNKQKILILDLPFNKDEINIKIIKATH